MPPSSCCQCVCWWYDLQAHDEVAFAQLQVEAEVGVVEVEVAVVLLLQVEVEVGLLLLLLLLHAAVTLEMAGVTLEPLLPLTLGWLKHHQLGEGSCYKG